MGKRRGPKGKGMRGGGGGGGGERTKGHGCDMMSPWNSFMPSSYFHACDLKACKYL